MQLRGSSVPDSNGSPMNVSAILNYRVTDAVAFTYSVSNPHDFIQNQAYDVLRAVCTLFPYRGKNQEPSLMSDGKLIGACMRELV